MHLDMDAHIINTQGLKGYLLSFLQEVEGKCKIKQDTPSPEELGKAFFANGRT